MFTKSQPPRIPLPKGWQGCVKSAAIYAFSLAHCCILQRLKSLSPSMGKVKVAETLCRAGLHLGVTTVGRILKESPQSDPGAAPLCTRVVTAKRPNHVWHVDLTAVPTSLGFWASWLPFALPQCWPLCWWVAVVIDHHSRRVMGFETFRNNPTAGSVSQFLECAMHTANATPKYIICDKGQQFWCSVFKGWCDRQGVTPRFGAVGQLGSIALIERFILTLKNECMRIILVPLGTDFPPGANVFCQLVQSESPSRVVQWQDAS